MFTRFLSLVGAFTLLAAVLVGLSALARPESTAAAQPAPTAKPMALPPTAVPLPDTPLGQWRCEYFGNRDFMGKPVFTDLRVSPDFNSRNGGLPGGVSESDFALRCVSRQVISALDTYIFRAQAKGAIRLLVDDRVIINRWTVGTHDERATVTLNEGVHTVVAEFYNNSGRASLAVDWLAGCVAWAGRFYNNLNFQSPIVTKRCDGDTGGPLIIDIGAGALAEGLPVDNVSALWEQDVRFKAGTYEFRVEVDDGVQISIDRGKPFDNEGKAGTYTFTRRMRNGSHNIQVLFVERGGDARIKLTWQRLP